MGWFGEVRNSYCRCPMLLKANLSITQICRSPHSLRIRISTHLCSTLFGHPCTHWNRWELLVSGQPVVDTCNSPDFTPLVILIFPEACKVHLRLWVSDLVILEPVVTIRNSARIYPPQASMPSHLLASLKKQAGKQASRQTPRFCPVQHLLLTCLHEMMWLLSSSPQRASLFLLG